MKTRENDNTMKLPSSVAASASFALGLAALVSNANAAQAHHSEFARSAVTAAVESGQFHDDQVLSRPRVLSQLIVKGLLQSTMGSLTGLVEAKKIGSDEDFLLLVFKDDGYAQKAFNALQVGNQVEFVEPNYLLKPTLVPNDPLYPKSSESQALLDRQWTLKSLLPEDAWDQLGNENQVGDKEVVIAILDTGIDYNHPEIAPNLWSNSLEISDGDDNDGNGYVDDLFGWDFVFNTNNPIDDDGHGTHVAAIAAGAGNNAAGIAGVAWSVSIMPIQVCNYAYGYGCPLDAIIQGIRYAKLNGAHVINMSLGGYFDSAALKQEVETARDLGLLIVTSAGNDTISNDLYKGSPASLDVDNIISVAASDAGNTMTVSGALIDPPVSFYDAELAPFSNSGPTEVEIAAPGMQVLSAFPTNLAQVVSSQNFEGDDVSLWTFSGLNLRNDIYQTDGTLGFKYNLTAGGVRGVGINSSLGMGQQVATSECRALRESERTNLYLETNTNVEPGSVQVDINGSWTQIDSTTRQVFWNMVIGEYPPENDGCVSATIPLTGSDQDLVTSGSYSHSETVSFIGSLQLQASSTCQPEIPMGQQPTSWTTVATYDPVNDVPSSTTSPYGFQKIAGDFNAMSQSALAYRVVVTPLTNAAALAKVDYTAQIPTGSPTQTVENCVPPVAVPGGSTATLVIDDEDGSRDYTIPTACPLDASSQELCWYTIKEMVTKSNTVSSTQDVEYSHTAYSVAVDDFVVRKAGLSLSGESVAYLDGTSMAAPYVAGTAALIMAQDPSLIGDREAYKTLKGRILASATQLDQLRATSSNGNRGVQEGRHLNLRRALALPYPIAVEVQPNQATITWENHAITATSLDVQRNLGSGWETLVAGANLSPSTSQYVDNTVPSGASPEYRIVVNDSGNGWSEASLGYGQTVPYGPVQNTTVTQSNNEVRVDWTANGGGGIYIIQRKADGEYHFGEAGRVNAPTITFLDNTVVPDTTYIYRVVYQDTNTGETSPSSDEVSITVQDVTSPAPSSSGGGGGCTVDGQNGSLVNHMEWGLLALLLAAFRRRWFMR